MTLNVLLADPLASLVVSSLGLCGLRSEDADSAGSDDLGLGRARKVLGLNNKRLLVELASAEDLEETLVSDVEDGDLGRVLGVLLTDLSGDHRPQLLNVHDRAVLPVTHEVVLAHTDLSKVSRVELVEQRPVVVLATGVTATRRMLPVLTDTTVSGRHVSPLLTVLLQSSSLKQHTTSKGQSHCCDEYKNKLCVFQHPIGQLCGPAKERVQVVGKEDENECKTEVKAST